MLHYATNKCRFSHTKNVAVCTLKGNVSCYFSTASAKLFHCNNPQAENSRFTPSHLIAPPYYNVGKVTFNPAGQSHCILQPLAYKKRLVPTCMQFKMSEASKFGAEESFIPFTQDFYKALVGESKSSSFNTFNLC